MADCLFAKKNQECLFNPAASFLSGYSSLLRADLDTFPTPGGDNGNDDNDNNDGDDDGNDHNDDDDDQHWLNTGILGLRPRTVICYRGEAYTHHRYVVITNMIIAASESSSLFNFDVVIIILMINKSSTGRR